MAKEQDLSLNPQKISGVCGRLMCCLNYEYEHYREARRCLPKLGATIQTPKGKGKIIEINVLRGDVIVNLEEGSRVTLPFAEVAQHRPGCPHECGHAAAPPAEDPDLGPDALPDDE